MTGHFAIEGLQLEHQILVSQLLLETAQFGLTGWQWMFVTEGLPAVALGATVFFLLHDRIADARWLSPDEKRGMQAALDREARAKAHHSVRDGRHGAAGRRFSGVPGSFPSRKLFTSTACMLNLNRRLTRAGRPSYKKAPIAR